MVLRRSANAILLGAKQRRMTSIVSNQIYEREKSSKLMINILSHIVEFRNGESGLHVLHIQTITENAPFASWFRRKITDMPEQGADTG